VISRSPVTYRNALRSNRQSAAARHELQTFHRDLDETWRSEQAPPQERISALSPLDPGLAAARLRPVWIDLRESNWQDRLGSLGFLVGRLHAFPSQVEPFIGVWRSDRPVILVRDGADFNDPTVRQQLALVLGELIYGTDDPRAPGLGSMLSAS